MSGLKSLRAGCATAWISGWPAKGLEPGLQCGRVLMDMKLAICQGPSLEQAACGLAITEAVLSVLNTLSSLEPVTES